jgi:hypothetical protein
MSEQAQSSLPDELGDALYHPTGGWAFVTEEAATMDGTKLRVYRQNRAGEILIKSNFYLNVTKTALWDADLSIIRTGAQSFAFFLTRDGQACRTWTSISQQSFGNRQSRIDLENALLDSVRGAISPSSSGFSTRRAI